MQYHEAMIILHRPFLSNFTGAPTTAPTNSPAEVSGRMCEESATAICRLFGLYRQQWKIRLVHPQVVALILTAALIHAHNSCVFSGQRGLQAQENIFQCVQVLGEMSHFNNSLRALEVVVSLRREWQNQTFRPLKTKRSSPEA
jgi:hypothetical protein